MEVGLEKAIAQEGFRLPVDVRVLNRAPLSFQYSVVREGILVLVRDDDHRVVFEMRTRSRYFDFAPFREAYLAEKLGDLECFLKEFSRFVGGDLGKAKSGKSEKGGRAEAIRA